MVAKCTKKLCRKNKLVPLLRRKYDVVSSGSITASDFKTKIEDISKLFMTSS